MADADVCWLPPSPPSPPLLSSRPRNIVCHSLVECKTRATAPAPSAGCLAGRLDATHSRIASTKLVRTGCFSGRASSFRVQRSLSSTRPRRLLCVPAHALAAPPSHCTGAYAFRCVLVCVSAYRRCSGVPRPLGYRHHRMRIH